MNFIKEYPKTFSFISSLLISFVWFLIVIVYLGNKASGDNGSDPFGYEHIIFFLVSIPFIFIGSFILINKYIKSKS